MTPKNLLRALIRESLLQESSDYIPHAEVVAAIDNAIRPERLDVKIPGFRDLMIELAVVESGLKVKGQLSHTNEQDKDIRGVFQLSSTALKQLRNPAALRQTKAKFDASSASVKKWAEQTNEDIFGNVKLQAIAACMYALWTYYELANEPNISNVFARAAFWDKFYNTASDEKGTPAYYINKLKELMS